MRIRVIQRCATPSIDGLQLQRFEDGRSYDVGNTLGSRLLAEGLAVPDDDDPPTRPAIRMWHQTPRPLRDIAADFARKE